MTQAGYRMVHDINVNIHTIGITKQISLGMFLPAYYPHTAGKCGSLCADSNAIPCVLSTDDSQGSRTTDEAWKTTEVQ